MSEQRSAAARPDTGAKQGFIGVDIPHSAQQSLVQECTLNWSLAFVEECREMVECDLERFGSWSFKVLDDAEPSEAAGIDKAKFAAGGQLQNRVSVFLQFQVRRADQQASCHSEMHNPLCRRGCPTGRFEIEDNVFSHASDSRNPLGL